MKLTNIMILILGLILFSNCQNDKYELEWKIDKKKSVYYKTEMKPIEIKYDNKDSSNSNFSGFKEAYNDLLSETKNYNQYTVLDKLSDDNIRIQMISFSINNDTEQNDKNEIFSSSFEGIILKGEIDKYGIITSKYLQTKQKNLISVLFQLPSVPVKIGDKWKVDVDFIQMGSIFICENSDERNIVQLKNIKEREDTLIAEIEYDVFSMVSGKIENNFSDAKQDISLSYGFIGIGEFDIERGKWITFNGIFNSEKSGIMATSFKQSIQLLESKSIPKGVNDILNGKKTVYGRNLESRDKMNNKKERTTVSSEKEKDIDQDCPFFYRVQIASSKNKLSLSSDLFESVSEKVNIVIKENEEIKYKYTVGKECSYEKAVEIRNEMKQNGFKDAFIIKEINK